VDNYVEKPQFAEKKANVFLRAAVHRPEALIFLTFFQIFFKKRLTP